MKQDLFDHAKELIRYCPETGAMTWKVDRKGRAKKGSACGTRHPDGYISIRLKGKVWLAHRLAWLLQTGRLPTGDIDHINGIPYDNRWKNLRECSRAENQQSCATRKSKTGITGVYQSGKKFRAVITHQKTIYPLGSFSTAEQAKQAYLEAKSRLHSFQPTPRSNAAEGSKLMRAK